VKRSSRVEGWGHGQILELLDSLEEVRLLHGYSQAILDPSSDSGLRTSDFSNPRARLARVILLPSRRARGFQGAKPLGWDFFRPRQAGNGQPRANHSGGLNMRQISASIRAMSDLESLPIVRTILCLSTARN